MNYGEHDGHQQTGEMEQKQMLGTVTPPPARQTWQTGLGVHRVGWIGRSECKAYLGEGTHKDGW